MSGMDEGLEIEVKLRFEAVEEALAKLARLPARLVEPRAFEDNDVYDTRDGALSRDGTLLRLRVTGGSGMLTLKEKVETDLRAKVRTELQSGVGSPEAIRRMLTRLGFVRVYRYQKHRSYYSWSDPESAGPLSISLDETPIGVFVELEGAKDAIDSAAGRMGMTEDHYILDDYRTLHRAWLDASGRPPGDMVFPA